MWLVLAAVVIFLVAWGGVDEVLALSTNDNILPPSFYFDVYKTDPLATPWSVGGPQPVVRQLCESGALRGLKVLDAGCGTGENARAILEEGRAKGVLGFDISEDAVKVARVAVEGSQGSWEFKVWNCTSDFLSVGREGEFDAVVDSGLLHCLSDDEIKAYAVNLRSLVTVGGKVYIGCFSDENPDPWDNPQRISEMKLKETFSIRDGWMIESIARKWWKRPSERGTSSGGAWSMAWWCVIVRATTDIDV